MTTPTPTLELDPQNIAAVLLIDGWHNVDAAEAVTLATFHGKTWKGVHIRDARGQHRYLPVESVLALATKREIETPDQIAAREAETVAQEEARFRAIYRTDRLTFESQLERQAGLCGQCRNLITDQPYSHYIPSDDGTASILCPTHSPYKPAYI